MAENILIIDDDMYLRDLYKELLEGEGYQVKTAGDGAEGLKLLQQGGYNLILLDVMMPKLDGLGVLTKLKEIPPKKPNGSIVLLTNLTHDPVINQAMQLGVKAVYVKADLTPGQLVDKVKTLLET